MRKPNVVNAISIEHVLPLAELAAMLTRDQPVTGVVVSLTGSAARIATSSGMVQARTEEGIIVDAWVRVVDGIARHAITPTGTYPVVTMRMPARVSCKTNWLRLTTQ